MKNTLYLFVSVLFLSSCAIQGPTVSYEKSNASLIQKSIKNLNTVKNLEGYLSKNDKIVFIGIEDKNTSDYSLLATLEDEIIKEFVVNGYNILERDNDLIYRMLSEEKENYVHINREKKNMVGYAVSQKEAAYGSSYIYGYADAKSQSERQEVTNFKETYNSQLSSADKIISYRVIESGIHYYNINDNPDARIGELKREARTILEVRLIDSKTSEILEALTLDGIASDNVKEEDRDALKDFGYRFYRHSLPKTHGQPEESYATGKRPNVLPWVAGGLGFILLISLLAGG